MLASQWGDYGLPPSESAFALHALVIGELLKGGWFPEGGAGRIARTFETGIEASGGAIKVCHEVTEILIEGGRAVGVKALDRRGAEPSEVVFRAPVVISDVGARITYASCCRPTARSAGGPPRRAPISTRWQAACRPSRSMSGSPSPFPRSASRARTIGSTRRSTTTTSTRHTAAVLAGEPRHAYLSFPSAKSGDDRFHTAEIIAILRPEAFAAWRGTATGQRGRDYAELKDRIAQGLLRLADSAVPGLLGA